MTQHAGAWSQASGLRQSGSTLDLGAFRYGEKQKLNSTREGGSEYGPLLMGGVIITNIHMCEAV